MMDNAQITTIVINVLNVALVLINAYFLKRNHSALSGIIDKIDVPELVNSSLKK